MKDLRDSLTMLWDARAQLRAHLRTLEPETYVPPAHDGVVLDDTDMLRLLENVQLTFAADENPSRARYAAAVAGVAGAVTFDALHHDGWFALLFGRIVTPINVSVAAMRSRSAPAGVRELLSQRFGVTYARGALPRGTKAIDDVVDGLIAGTSRFTDVTCRTPTWVAARLWEQRPAVADPLIWWLDRWKLLGSPYFSLATAWDGAVAQDFVHLVLDRLDVEPALIGWNAVRQTIANQSRRAGGESGPASTGRLPTVPDTVVGRARWLGDPWLGEMAPERAEAFEEVRDLVAIIIGDIEQRRYGAVPDPQFAQLSALALDRPDLLHFLIQRATRHPLLVAELLVQSATCALGCWLLTLRPLGGEAGASEDDRASAEAVLTDGLALLRRFLEGENPGTLPDEAAALLAGVFDTVGRPRRLQSVTTAEAMVLAALAALGDGAVPIADALAKVNAGPTLDAPSFIAALELAAAADLTALVAPEPLPCAYEAIVQRGDRQLTAERMSPAAASVLFRLAQRGGPARISRFLYPIDWQHELQDLAEEDFDGQTKVTRALGAITRVLACAVAGLGAAAPADLVGALAAHIVAGSEDDWAAGKIWAFGAKLLSLPWSRVSEKSLGSLLGNALSALDPATREPLLVACLTLREPALLADIYKAAPEDARPRIAARIDAIGTDGATLAYSFTTLTARVDALLDAGLTAAADRHLDVVRQAKTSGAVSERARVEFNQGLRILYQREDWTAIGAATIPEGLGQFERDICKRILESFQAIALLRSGKSGAAVDRLTRLVRDNPAELGHKVNLFAARISAALGATTFPLLAPADQPPARALVDEVERWVARTTEATSDDRARCNFNLVPLDLALGEPRRALDRLHALPSDRNGVSQAAYRIMAYYRLGRESDARDALDDAIETFGPDPLLEAVCGELGMAASAGQPAPLSIDTEVERPIRLARALLEFENSRAIDKAEILKGSPDDLPVLIAELIDDALCALINLAPIINRGVLSDNEDDVSIVIRQLLNARLAHLNWSVSDQSLGGYTANQNPGERDFVVLEGPRELAIIEAVIADGSIPKGELVRHFRKLLGYGDCPLFVHLTYAWAVNMSDLTKTLEDIARQEAPAGEQFLDLVPHVRAGSEPHGFTARFRRSDEIVRIVFRVLDLGQDRLRHAAASAKQPVNKPSRKPRTK